jgi:anti-sigma factor RsiW
MSFDDQELSAMIRKHATRHTAPDSLRAAVRTQTALADAGRRSERPAAGIVVPWRWFSFGWGTASAGFALGMLCMALLLPLAQRLNLGEPIDADLVGHHVRALQIGPITEVVSTDRHTVKPWFQGRVDFAPPVFDLTNDGFPLMGGRIEHVRGDAVAALAYARNRHVVDLFIWPSADRQAPVRSIRRGFNVIHWSDGSMQYWAISDMERQEVESFARLWQERAAAR